MPRRCSFKLELEFPQPLAGVDEAGCAPLAGPVVAAACILNRDKFPRGIDDSKNLPIEKREALYAKLVKCASWGVGIASVEEIDQINIYWARMLAMTRAVEALGHRARLDPGRRKCLPEVATAIEGDRRRRREVPLDCRCFDYRQGDPRPDDGRLCDTVSRLRLGAEPWLSDPRPPARLARIGPTPIHRRSFGLVRSMLEQAAQPGLVFEILDGESSAPHPPAVESPRRGQTQHIVEIVASGRLTARARLGR